jgi:hypothetical protein
VQNLWHTLFFRKLYRDLFAKEEAREFSAFKAAFIWSLVATIGNHFGY